MLPGVQRRACQERCALLIDSYRSVLPFAAPPAYGCRRRARDSASSAQPFPKDDLDSVIGQIVTNPENEIGMLPLAPSPELGSKRPRDVELGIAGGDVVAHLRRIDECVPRCGCVVG